VVTGRGLTPVLSTASVAGYQSLAPGTRAVPVVRQAGSIRVGSARPDVVQFVGLDPAGLRTVRRWPNVVGGSSPGSVARALAVLTPAPGVPLPAGRTIRVNLAAPVPQIDVTAWLHADDGRERSVPLIADSAGTALTGTLPDATGPWSLASLSLSQPVDDATHRQHALGEGTTGRAVPSGRVTLHTVQVDGRSLTRPWSGWTGTGLSVSGAGDDAVLDFRLIASSQVVTATAAGPGAADSTVPLPVAADPQTAAHGPLITLTLNGLPVRARVVAVLPRFPTVAGRFVVADRTALSLLVDRTDPGTGQPAEVWLDVPGGGGSSGGRPAGSSEGTIRARLAAAPFSGVEVQWASDLERNLRTDPVARGAVQLLMLTAILTMLVALAGLVLLVVGERFEDADELYTWEANGVPPGALRQALWIRAVLIAVLAVPVGVVGGLVLTRLTARLVDATAGAQQSQPPLVPVTGLGTALPTVLIGLLLALAAAGVVALMSFREPLPSAVAGRAQ
jgi:hypothetical protein